ncbi:MAG TPA: RNA polymerase sigma factor [Candidatus Eisenbacteria bacterium]|nr:RNA polymerase sigma factor [Candidatus Eisenbacteria bacterium]
MALAGDLEDSFDAQYTVLFTELTRLCRALGAADTSEDIAQESLIEGRSHLDQLRDSDALRAWLRVIAVRRVTRQRAHIRSTSEHELSYVPVDAELGMDASAAVMRLPQRERIAVVLVHGLGYRQEEAAEMLGITRGTIAASLWKARRKLARDLAPYRQGLEQ